MPIDALKGQLYGVSVGPGDPELLTLKAVRVLQQVDCVAVPNIGHGRQTALSIVREYIEGKRIIDCSTPMTRDHTVTQAAYDAIADKLAIELDAGNDVAMVTMGDAGIYSTYYYVHKRLVARGYNAQVIPGVPSFCAAAARLGRPLCEGSENLLVTPVASGDVDQILDISANKVFMKSGKQIMQLKDKLAAHGQLDNASLVVDCGLPGDQVYEHFSDVTEPTGYFSIVLTSVQAPPA